MYTRPQKRRNMSAITIAEGCKLRCPLGSEYGTCACETPDDCSYPPDVTPVGELIRALLEGKEETVN